MTRQNIALSPEQLRENLQSALKQWSEKGEPAPFWARLGLFQQALHHCHGNAALALTTAGGTFALARFLLNGTLLTSTVIAILVLLIAFTPVGILAARLTGTPVLVGNLGWGCGVLVMTLLFFGLCGLSGAVAALLVQAAGLAAQ